MTGKGKRALAGMALGVGLFAVSAAGVAQEGRFYAGGSLGQAEGSDFCSLMRGLVAGTGSISSCDEKDTGFKFFGGYQVNPNFAVEANYIDYGEASARGINFGVPVSATVGVTAWGVGAVGILPVSPQFSLFGKIGMLISEADVSASGPGGSVSDSDSETGVQFAAGALFHLTPQISLRGEWERNDEAEIDMLSIGVQFRF